MSKVLFSISSRKLSRENAMRVRKVVVDCESGEAKVECSYGTLMPNGAFNRRRTDELVLTPEQLSEWHRTQDVNAIATVVAKLKGFEITPVIAADTTPGAEKLTDIRKVEAPQSTTSAGSAPPADASTSDTGAKAGAKPASKPANNSKKTSKKK